MKVYIPEHDFLLIAHEDGEGNYVGYQFTPNEFANYKVMRTTVAFNPDGIPYFLHFVRQIE